MFDEDSRNNGAHFVNRCTFTPLAALACKRVKIVQKVQWSHWSRVAFTCVGKVAVNLLAAAAQEMT